MVIRSSHLNRISRVGYIGYVGRIGRIGASKHSTISFLSTMSSTTSMPVSTSTPILHRMMTRRHEALPAYTPPPSYRDSLTPSMGLRKGRVMCGVNSQGAAAGRLGLGLGGGGGERGYNTMPGELEGKGRYIR